MLKKRLIPVLFLKNGLIVRSENFEDFREMGNPVSQLERLRDWKADELIYVDITRDGEHDLKRDDHKFKMQERDTLAFLRQISQKSFMPLTFGGRIRSLEHAAQFVANGADKVILNTEAYRRPELVGALSRHFGAQCVVVGIDVRRHGDSCTVFIDQGRQAVPETPVEYARKAQSLGAGEIFLNSIDRDGSAAGYDLELVEEVARAVSIPVIACGGAGSFEDFEEVLSRTQASAAAAGNIFNFTENAYVRAKKYLVEHAVPVRPWMTTL